MPSVPRSAFPAWLARLRPDLAVSLGARGMEAAAKFGLYALAAHRLGGHDAGRFFLALGVIQMVSTVAKLGLERPVTRHVAAELAVGDVQAARRAALTAGGAMLVASVAFSALLALAAPVVAIRWLGQPDMVPVLILAALIVPAQNLVFWLGSVLIGLERGAAAQMILNALPPTLSLAALLLGADSVERLLIAYAAAFGLCGLIGAGLVLTTHWSARETSDAASADLPGLWTGARALLIVEVSAAMLLTAPVLLLGAFADAASVSVFSICSRLSMLVTIVVLSLGSMSAPAFARHHRLGDWEALHRAVLDNRRVTVALCLPLIAALALAAHPLLVLLGVPASQGLTVLLILLTGQLVFCLLPSRDLVLAMAGEERTLRRLSLWQVGLILVLCLALIPPLGAVGAALASAVIWTGGAVALAFALRRRLPQLSR